MIFIDYDKAVQSISLLYDTAIVVGFVQSYYHVILCLLDRPLFTGSTRPIDAPTTVTDLLLSAFGACRPPQSAPQSLILSYLLSPVIFNF